VLYLIISCHATLSRSSQNISSYDFISYHIISCHVISHHILSPFFKVIDISMYSSLILQIGKTALHLAAEKGFEDTVQLLIGRGSDIKATDAVMCMCVRHVARPLPLLITIFPPLSSLHLLSSSLTPPPLIPLLIER
jgi:Ankyrin repeat